MVPNPAGNMIQTVWDEIPFYYTGIQIGAFAVMPNHIHGIIVIVGATPRGCPVFPPAIARVYPDRPGKRAWAEAGKRAGRAGTGPAPTGDAMNAGNRKTLSLGDKKTRRPTMVREPVFSYLVSVHDWKS